MAADTTVRVTEQTRRDLTAYMNRLRTAVDRNPALFPDWLKEVQINLGSAIRWLLEKRNEHMERGRKASKARCKSPAATVDSPVGPAPDAPGQTAPLDAGLPDVASAEVV